MFDSLGKVFDLIGFRDRWLLMCYISFEAEMSKGMLNYIYSKDSIEKN